MARIPWLYGIQSGLFIKVGVAQDIPQRLNTMNLYNPHPCRVIARRQTPFAYAAEKRAHKALTPYAIGREWFTADAELVRAVFTLVINQVKSEHARWIVECEMSKARRDTAKDERAASGRHVEKGIP